MYSTAFIDSFCQLPLPQLSHQQLSHISCICIVCHIIHETMPHLVNASGIAQELGLASIELKAWLFWIQKPYYAAATGRSMTSLSKKLLWIFRQSWKCWHWRLFAASTHCSTVEGLSTWDPGSTSPYLAPPGPPRNTYFTFWRSFYSLPWYHHSASMSKYQVAIYDG
jgi:hypothetical protein